MQQADLQVVSNTFGQLLKCGTTVLCVLLRTELIDPGWTVSSG